MERITEISTGLWLVVEAAAMSKYGDGLFSLRDDAGGDTLISKDALPALITALQSLQAEVQS